MSATPPQNGHTASRGGGGSSQDEADQRVYYSRFVGWLVLAVILAYAGLQMPLPWRLLTIAAGLIGVVGAVVLFVQALRKKLSAAMVICAVAVVLCCGLFVFTAGMQVTFWPASEAFETCMRHAVTQRALDQCYNDYEQDIFSLIPGMP